MKEIEAIVIGSGPAGLMATYKIGKDVILLEKKNEISKKLLISGNGQCNYTHTGDVAEFIGVKGFKAGR